MLTGGTLCVCDKKWDVDEYWSKVSMPSLEVENEFMNHDSISWITFDLNPSQFQGNFNCCLTRFDQTLELLLIKVESKHKSEIYTNPP